MERTHTAMAIRNIVMGNDPLLRKKSREVTAFDTRLHILLEDMAETLHTAMGAGLAAVQVGVLRNVVVVDVGDEDGLIELVNPKIIHASEDTVTEAEGCLSFPSQWGMVERPRVVTVQARDRYGNPFEITGEGQKARAFCHEIDHLQGIVYKDIACEMLESDDE